MLEERNHDMFVDIALINHLFALIHVSDRTTETQEYCKICKDEVYNYLL